MKSSYEGKHLLRINPCTTGKLQTFTTDKSNFRPTRSVWCYANAIVLYHKQICSIFSTYIGKIVSQKVKQTTF